MTFLWTSYTHQTCMNLVSIVHTSGMHARSRIHDMMCFCEHRTHIRHVSYRVYTTWCFLWTSYTHQACTLAPVYTTWCVFVNIVHTHQACKLPCIHDMMFFVNIVHTSGHAWILWTSYTTWCFREHRKRHDVFVNIVHTSQGMHACMNLVNIVHDMTFLWTSYAHHRACMHESCEHRTRHDVFMNIVHTSDMHESCEHRTHIRHARSLPYTRHDVFCEHRTHIRHVKLPWIHDMMFFVNIVHTSGMHARSRIHDMMFFVNIVHTSGM
jgi:hypothetical protein